jgi:hypothetical protein
MRSGKGIFLALASLILTRILDPVITQQMIGIITGMGG